MEKNKWFDPEDALVAIGYEQGWTTHTMLKLACRYIAEMTVAQMACSEEGFVGFLNSVVAEEEDEGNT